MFIKITGYREVSPGHPMRLIVDTEKIEELKDLGDGTYMMTLDSGTVEYTDRDYELACSTADRFLYSRYKITDNRDDCIPKADLYQEFTDWCGQEDIRPFSRQRFYEEVLAMGIEEKKVMGVRMFYGIKKKST